MASAPRVTLMYKELRYLGKNYEIVKPIYVEVAASRDDDGVIYCMTVVDLNNELIFGIGRTSRQARRLLRKLLVDYYETLMSCDLNNYSGSENHIYGLDRDTLKGSIHKNESSA